MTNFKIIIFTLLAFSSTAAMACGELKIPIKVINYKDNENSVHYQIQAPLEYEEWRLSGGSYRYADSVIPMKLTNDLDTEGMGLFVLRLDKKNIEESKAVISYRQIGKIDENGVNSISLCSHAQGIEFDI